MTRFVLEGLPGENPLGFMAAVGTLLVAERAWPEGDARLSWVLGARGWRPVLVLAAELGRQTLLDGLLAEVCRAGTRRRAAQQRITELQGRLEEAKKQAALDADALKPKLKRAERKAFVKQRLEPVEREVAAAETEVAAAAQEPPDEATALGPNLKLKPEALVPPFLRGAQMASPGARRVVDLFAAFASEVVTDQDGNAVMSRWSKQNGNSGKNMLADVEKAMLALDARKLERALFLHWDHADEKWSLGWDPADVRPFAHQATNPAVGATTMHGANVLAFEAMSVWPVMVHRGRAVTLGVVRQDRHWRSTWPLWSCGLRGSVVRSLLSQPTVHADKPDRALLAAQGVTALFRAEHFTVNENSARFRPARPL